MIDFKTHIDNKLNLILEKINKFSLSEDEISFLNSYSIDEINIKKETEKILEDGKMILVYKDKIYDFFKILGIKNSYIKNDFNEETYFLKIKDSDSERIIMHNDNKFLDNEYETIIF
jgi:hypothetical protein